MMKAVENRIYELRQENNLSLEQFACIIDSSPTAVWNWELGKTDIRVKNALRICKKFGVSMDWLCGLTDCT